MTHWSCMQDWNRRVLGRTGLLAGRLGMAASYGVPATAVERAFEGGVNYFYWGSMRKGAFADALRHLAPRRDKFILVLQSYSRVGGLVGWSMERALRTLHFDYADVLLLGLWNRAIPKRIFDAALAARERGLIRHVAISTRHRPLVPVLAANPDIGVVHLRYNAVHVGAEREIFPHLPADANRPGIVSFTATSWRQLLNPKKTPAGEKTPTATDCNRFVLTNPAVDVCLSGPANDEQTTAALRALQLGPMGPEELAWMRRVGLAIKKH